MRIKNFSDGHSRFLVTTYLNTDPLLPANKLTKMPMKTTMISSCWKTLR